MEDLTDNEREEQLRRWWSDNWAWIIGGVALGLAVLGGWQYWQRHQQQSAELDATSYRAVVEALGRNQRDEAVKQAAELRERRPASPYADQSDLALARAAVERNELDEAARLLKGVADRSKDPELRLVAQTRLARVLIALGKPDEALALLDPAKAGAFVALAHDIRGDALSAKGDVPAAQKEYDAALAASTGPDSGVDREYLEQKRDALSASAVAPVVQPAPAEAPVPTEVPAK